MFSPAWKAALNIVCIYPKRFAKVNKVFLEHPSVLIFFFPPSYPQRQVKIYKHPLGIYVKLQVDHNLKPLTLTFYFTI